MTTLLSAVFLCMICMFIMLLMVIMTVWILDDTRIGKIIIDRLIEKWDNKHEQH